MPKGGNWEPLKNNATNFIKQSGQGSVSPTSLINSYIKANGGTQAISQGRGGGGKRSSVHYGIGGSAIRTGSKLGSFLSSVVPIKNLNTVLHFFGITSVNLFRMDSLVGFLPGPVLDNDFCISSNSVRNLFFEFS